MKNYEIKRIKVGSVFKFNLCVGFVFGLVIGMVFLIMGYTLRDLGLELGTLEGPVEIGAGILGAILASALEGLMLGAIGAILAFLYNLFAAAVGGIAVGLHDGS
ncbi:MAG: DUF3566 domain-containing protein [Firmicutes bacterium]|nr:DUF3566 domain-containing protein [Bacillota bacterium]